MAAHKRIIIPLDVDDIEQVSDLIEELAPHVGCFKIGHQLQTSVGTPQAVKFVHDRGGEVFLDGKWKDIPNTMAGAARAASRQGIWMFNVLGDAGVDGILAAVENRGGSMVFVVTVPTSQDDTDAYLLYGKPVDPKVLEFAYFAKLAGAQGIICAAPDVPKLKKRRELKGLYYMTPGVRPAYAAADDQKRIMTPGEAIRAGADYLVIGRPITNPPASIGSRVKAAKLVAEEIEAALEDRSN